MALVTPSFLPVPGPLRGQAGRVAHPSGPLPGHCPRLLPLPPRQEDPGNVNATLLASFHSGQIPPLMLSVGLASPKHKHPPRSDGGVAKIWGTETVQIPWKRTVHFGNCGTEGHSALPSTLCRCQTLKMIKCHCNSVPWGTALHVTEMSLGL